MILKSKSAKTLYLHIGHYKTGTSALQLFCEQNPGFLAKHGIGYADHRRFHAKHSYLGFSLLRAAGVTRLMHGYPFKESPGKVWGDFFDAVRASPYPQVLASTEELIRIGAYPKAADALADVARLSKGIDVRIIAYFRQPEDHLQSWYNQLIKMGEPVQDFGTTVETIIEDIHFDYEKALRPWVDTFGREAIIARPYVRGSGPDKALYADFLSVLGIELPRMGVSFPSEDPNPRLGIEETDLMRLINSAGLPPAIADWTQTRAAEYLEAQAQQAVRAPLTSEQIQTRISAGLEFLQTLPDSGIKADMFQVPRSLAAPPSPQDAWLLAGFLLREIHVLRQRLHQTNSTLSDRIAALENAQAKDG